MENSAGAGQLCGGTMEELGAFVRAIGHPNLRVCLDTAHTWAAGYAIDTRDGVERFFDLVERELGLDRVVMFHFNDTEIELGGHRDRHWHIGEGRIGIEASARSSRIRACKGRSRSSKHPAKKTTTRATSRRCAPCSAAVAAVGGWRMRA